MKLDKLFSIPAAALLAALVSSALAQPAPPPPPPAAADQSGPKLARLKAKMEMRPEQEAAFETVRRAHASILRPLLAARRDLVKKLSDQIQANDGSVVATLDALKASTKAINDEKDRFDDVLKATLTPRQRAIYVFDSLQGLLSQQKQATAAEPAAAASPQ